MISPRLSLQRNVPHGVNFDDGGATRLSIYELIVALLCVLSKSKVGARLNDLSLSLLLQSCETQFSRDDDVEGARGVVLLVDTLVRFHLSHSRVLQQLKGKTVKGSEDYLLGGIEHHQSAGRN